MFRLPSEIPLNEYPPPEAFISEAERLVSEAKKEGLILRVMRGMAISMRCAPEHREVWRRLGRLEGRVFTDIDFVSYGKHQKAMIEFMKKNGYQMDPRMLFMIAKNRHIYFGTKIPMVEVFYDELDMNHRIVYKNRLESSDITVPLEELMLQKLQIVKINDKDLKDLMILFLSNNLGKGKDSLNPDLVAERYMASDWGFYYTSTMNLNKLREAVKANEVLTADQKKVIDDKAAAILQSFDSVPKSAGWKLRAKVGTKKQWYNVVDEW
ncbi:MAG: hypothetical protein QXE18_00765 [Thermoplasmata archaeon]